MKNLFLIASLFVFVSCSCMNSDTAFGLDGKAVSWCKAKKCAEKLCKKHDGVKDYSPFDVTCNDDWKAESKHWSER